MKQGRVGQGRLVRAVAGTIVVLAAATACGTEAPPEYDYITICVDNKGTPDQADDVRLSDTDRRCPDYLDDDGEPVWDTDDDDEVDESLWDSLFSDTDHSGSFVYISTMSNYQVPAVGQPVRYPYGVTPYKPTASKAVSYGTQVAPRNGTQGGVAQRGGFGVSSSGSAGG